MTPRDVPADDLELVPLADGALVDVAREDQLGAGVDERRRGRASGGRPASCASATALRSGGGGARRPAARPPAPRRGARAPARAAAPRIPPDWCRHGAHRVQPDHVQRRRAEDGLGRLPVPLELGERAREARREACTGCRGSRGSRARAGRASAGRRPPPRAAPGVRGASGRRSRRRARARARSISVARLRSTRGASRVPTWRSEMWRRRVGRSRSTGYTHGDGGRAYRDLRRPLSRSASGRRACARSGAASR